MKYVITIVLIVSSLSALAADTVNQVRYRAFGNSGGNDTGGSSVYLGVPNLGNPHNRIEQDLQWYTNGLPNSFEYGRISDGNGGRWFYSAVNGEPALITPDLLNSDYLADADRIVVQIWNRDGMAGGIDMPSFQLRWNNHIVGFYQFFPEGLVDAITIAPGVCFGKSQDWSLDGTIQALGPFTNSQEASKIEITLENSGFAPANRCTDTMFADGFED